MKGEQCWVQDCKVCAAAQEYHFSAKDIHQIALICLGMNRKEIRAVTAELSDISRERTADIRKKLGVRTAHGIRAWARERGLATHT